MWASHSIFPWASHSWHCLSLLGKGSMHSSPSATFSIHNIINLWDNYQGLSQGAPVCITLPVGSIRELFSGIPRENKSVGWPETSPFQFLNFQLITLDFHLKCRLSFRLLIPTYPPASIVSLCMWMWSLILLNFTPIGKKCLICDPNEGSRKSFFFSFLITYLTKKRALWVNFLLSVKRIRPILDVWVFNS